MVASLLVPIGFSLMLAARSASTALDFMEPNVQVTFSYPKVQSTPRFVIYSDSWTGSSSPPPPSAIEGFNVLNLGFLLLAGPWDNAQSWTTLSAAQRTSVKSQYAAAGIKLLVSAFGATDTPTSSGADPVSTARRFADWVKQYQLDGIDVDYEDINAFDVGDGRAENWLITFTKELRSHLAAGQYIITHAPVAPWFEPNNRWGGGGYVRINHEVGNLIDWYNVQFYNQGVKEYTTCTSLLYWSSQNWPNTSVFQMSGNGVPLSKIVIGKPATPGDATDGYVDPGNLASCLASAKSNGWDAGAMAWEYPKANSSWVRTVRSKSWKV